MHGSKNSLTRKKALGPLGMPSAVKISYRWSCLTVTCGTGWLEQTWSRGPGPGRAQVNAEHWPFVPQNVQQKASYSLLKCISHLDLPVLLLYAQL